MQIDLEHYISRAEGKLSTELDGETVILDMESGQYVGLDIIGTRIWDLIENKISVQGLVEVLVEEYDVERHDCLQDVQHFLSELAGNGLIVVH